MAKTDLEKPFDAVSGQLDKKKGIVFRTRYGKTSMYKMNKPMCGNSEKQLKNQELVREANRLVSEEFKDFERKMYWKTVAEDVSNKYKTARGAAFAHFLAELKRENS